MKVTATIQATTPAAPKPVEMTWYQGDDVSSVFTAIGQLLSKDDRWTRVLAINIEL